LLCALAPTGCRQSCQSEERGAGTASTSAAAPERPEITPLGESAVPLRQFFNATRGRHRFVAFLSPTCPACLDGARAIRSEIVARTSAAHWAIAVVWIPMRPTDDEAALDLAAAGFTGPRVRQFFDGHKRAGWAFARAAFPGFHSPAWDVYLFFGPRAGWDGELPSAPTYRFAQFLGPDRLPLVASDVDEHQRPIPLGPSARLGPLLRERVTALERAR
jgi:hypothetical protein